MRNKRYFVDMDGVLAKYEFNLPSYDTLYEEGYFLNRPPQENIVDAVRLMISYNYEVFILSAVLNDSEFALFEKHDWLDRYLPEVNCKHRIFTICGEDKISGVPHFDPNYDVLVDDFSGNTKLWKESGGTYVKVSRDTEDAIYECGKHRNVISPQMSPVDIVYTILHADNREV